MLTKKEKGKILAMLRGAMDKSGAIRKVAQKKRWLGTKHEEKLQCIADELEGQVIALGEELGFELDDLI